VGDTFVVDSGDDRYLFTFSPVGVRAFYGLPEERASKGVADWRMLRRKLPDEIFAGRRTLPHQLFGRDNVAAYLENVTRAVEGTVDELGLVGEVDVFDLTRRLGHRVGLSSWGGPGSAYGERFDRLARAFDALDGSESFVHPDAMAAVAAAGKASERRALGVVTDEIALALGELPGVEADHALFARVARAWDGQPAEGRAVGVALDVALIHVASMSNLFAALGWMLIDLLTHPDELARVRAGDRQRAEVCALESTRMAQRSIMARYVVEPVTIDVGDAVYDVSAGATIATLLPLTNTSAAHGLQFWDPGRWNRRRLADPSSLAAVELVTVFGHGRHTCPAQPFSLSAMTAAASRLVGAFDMEPTWTCRPLPVRAQIGGVARAAGSCPVRYRRR
jgi:cytochrome P450